MHWVLILSLLWFVSPAYAVAPIDANGNIFNPAADPGDNTDTGACSGDVFYFDNNGGSDSNNCLSAGNACKSATKWKNVGLGPGDCALFARGSTWNSDPDFESVPSGNSSNYIVFGSYGSGDRPRFIASSGSGPAWNNSNDKYVRWERMRIDKINTWRIETGSHHLQWHYVRLHDLWHNGFPVKGGNNGSPHHLEWIGIWIENTARKCYPGTCSATGEAFYISDNAKNPGRWGGEDILIQGCYLKGIVNEPISIKFDTFRITVDGCLIEENHRIDDPGMIQSAHSNNNNAGHVFKNNVIINNDNEAGGTYPAINLGDGASAYNNIIHNNAGAFCFRGKNSSNHFYHNTCYQNGASFQSGGGIPDSNIKNNIGTSSISGNIAESGSLFEDAGGNDFRLASGSAAIDLYSNCRGITSDALGVPRPINGDCDAGAFEFGGDPGDTEDPTAPSSLTATAVAPTQIDLSWTASTDNVAVTEYRIEQCSGSGCSSFSEVQTVDDLVTDVQIFGLLPSTLYRFRVRAGDASGNLSAYSNIDEDTTFAQPPLNSAYAVINAVAPTSSVVQSYTSTALNGTTPTFAIFMMSNVLTPGTDTQGMQMGFGFTDGGDQYVLMCSAEDNQDSTDNDCGAFDNYSIGIADYLGEPGSEICAASFAGFVSEGVVLDWDPACPASYQFAILLGSGVLVNAFDITSPTPSGILNNIPMGFSPDVVLGIKSRETSLMGEFAKASAVLNWMMAGRATLSSLSSSVAWRNSQGISIASSWVDNTKFFVCGQTNCLQDNPMESLTVGDYTATSIDLNFSKGTGQEYPFLAISNQNDLYAVEFIQTPAGADAGPTSYNLGLAPEFAMCVMSSTDTLVTTDATDNAGTQGVFVTDFTNTYSLGYTHSVGDDFVQTGTLFNTDIELNDSDGAQLYEGTITATGTGFDIDFTNNPAQQNYWLCMAAGSPDDSDTTAPSQPADLTSTSVTTTQITMGWSASTDDTGVTHYEFESCPGTDCPGGTWARTISASTTGTRSSLSPNSDYAFRVRAVDAAQNVSAWSDTTNVTTLALPGSGNATYTVTNVASATSTGTQTITNLRLGGEVPNVALLMMTGVTTLGTDIDGAQWGYGFTDGTSQYTLMCTAEHGQSSTDNDCGSFNNRVVGISDYTGSPGSQICSASFDAFVAGGVRIDWIEACPSAYQMVVVMASGVEAKAFDITVGSGTVPVTSLSFEADMVFGMKSREDDFAGDFGSASLVHNVFMGDNRATDASFSSSTAYQNSQSTAVATGFVDADQHQSCGDTNCGGGGFDIFTTEGYDSQGMDFVFTTTNNAGHLMPFLALGNGGSAHTVQMIQTPAGADAGSTAYSLGYTPGFLMCVMSGMDTEGSAIVGDNEAGKHGMFVTDFTETYSWGYTFEDNVSTTNTGTSMDGCVELNDVDKTMLYAALATPDANGYTINFETNPAQQNYWLCLSVEAPTAPAAMANQTLSTTLGGVSID